MPSSPAGSALVARLGGPVDPDTADLVVGERIRPGSGVYLHGQRLAVPPGTLVAWASPELARAGRHEGPQALADRLPDLASGLLGAGRRVDLVAGARHYLPHLLPVWEALPAECRGLVFCPVDVAGEAVARGAAVVAYRGRLELPRRAGPVVVGSYGDLKVARSSGRRVVYLEHGAGQDYGNGHPGYCGGRDRKGVSLILVPGPYAELAALRARPRARVIRVGDPFLDRLRPRPQNPSPVVAVSFHWNCQAAPETSATWGLWLPWLADLARRYKVIGHGHPRAWGFLSAKYAELGIEPVESWEDVLDRADCYICDNSSTAFEWAAHDRPLVLLDAPWYRREVELGLRFWAEAEIGIRCSQGALLGQAVEDALADPPWQKAYRQGAVRRIFGVLDGQAAARAARAIMEVSDASG